MSSPYTFTRLAVRPNGDAIVRVSGPNFSVGLTVTPEGSILLGPGQYVNSATFPLPMYKHHNVRACILNAARGA